MIRGGVHGCLRQDRLLEWSVYTFTSPSHHRNLALQGCILRGAVTSTREMNSWPLPANLTRWPGLMSCASGYAPGHLTAQSSVTWRADLTTIFGVPDADNTGIDDCDGAAARDYWREITLVRAFPTAFPHIPTGRRRHRHLPSTKEAYLAWYRVSIMRLHRQAPRAAP